jgi:hypothetical protein
MAPEARAVIRRVVRSILALGLGYAFGGSIGLAVAVVAMALLELFRVRTRFVWLASIAALIATPAATLAQGLPSTPVRGIRLTAVHVLPHRLAATALILAVCAVLVELSDPTRVDAAPLIPRARRRPSQPPERRDLDPAPRRSEPTERRASGPSRTRADRQAAPEPDDPTVARPRPAPPRRRGAPVDEAPPELV